MQTPIYKPQEEQELMSLIWSERIKDDPLAFVMYVFPWGEKGTPLERFRGPRKWQREVLGDLRDHIRENRALQEAKLPHQSEDDVAYKVLREAVSSGRGIGKSALVSWVVIWMVSTRIGSTTICWRAGLPA